MSYSQYSFVHALTDEGWQLWFLNLSGWPVFVVLVAIGVLVSFLVSVLLTKASSRSAVRTMAIATLAVAAIGLAGLAVVAWFARAR